MEQRQPGASNTTGKFKKGSIWQAAERDRNAIITQQRLAPEIIVH